MQQTKLGTLVWVGLIAVPVGWSISRIFDEVGDVLPPVPWALPVLLVFLAIILFAGARAVSGWIHERRFDARLDPLRVARFLVLAKAAELFGAALAGAYFGLGLLALGSLAVPMGRNRTVLAACVVVAAIVLTVAAVRLERACVAPPPSDDDDRPNGAAKA